MNGYHSLNHTKITETDHRINVKYLTINWIISDKIDPSTQRKVTDFAVNVTEFVLWRRNARVVAKSLTFKHLGGRRRSITLRRCIRTFIVVVIQKFF